MDSEYRYEQLEAEAAASEAARIGGDAGGEQAEDPAQRPVREGGGGEAEGFEEARDALVEHASHGDQAGAQAVLSDRGAPEDARAGEQEGGEADHERSSERESQSSERES